MVSTDDTDLVDPVALGRWLDTTLPGPPAPVEVSRHQAGHSCETFFVTRGDDRWVLRRPPRPPYLPTAHDVIREHRVLGALVDTPVRTPRPVIACEDPSVIGAPFYLMERAEGRVIRTELPDDLTPEHRPRIGWELVDALVELHAVDPQTVGLGDFGRPVGYVERQVARWQKQLAGAAAETARVRTLPDLEHAGAWLDENIPEPSGPATIVHGDYKLDNVMFAPGTPPRLTAIFDWEMSTRGEPLADVGWMLSYWRDPADPPSPRSEDTADVTRMPGFPSRTELLEHYEAGSGRAVRDVRFYLVLATWKLGIILEGSFARYLRGTTDDPMFPQLRDAVPAIGARAVELIDSGP